jgi:hypothetical protein
VQAKDVSGNVDTLTINKELEFSRYSAN